MRVLSQYFEKDYIQESIDIDKSITSLRQVNCEDGYISEVVVDDKSVG